MKPVLPTKIPEAGRLAEARRSGDVAAGVCFEWGAQNSSGGWFRLLREPHHTDLDVSNAKRALRNNRDVVSLSVERLREL